MRRIGLDLNADKRLPALFLLLAALAAAQTPQGVLDTFRVVARALAERDVRGFLEQFDPAMPNYDALQRNVAVLVSTEGAESSIEIVRDEGDGERRRMQIDWLLRVGTGTPKRGILKLAVERRGREWKITSLEPVDFFARN